MSASGSLHPDQFMQPEQLRLFMSAQELKNYLTDSYDRRFALSHDGKGVMESMNEMWDRKVEESKVPEDGESHGSGVMDSIEKHGYDWGHKSEIEIKGLDIEYHPSHDKTKQRFIPDGHHRIAAAADIEKRTGKEIYIPVRYSLWD